MQNLFPEKNRFLPTQTLAKRFQQKHEFAWEASAAISHCSLQINTLCGTDLLAPALPGKGGHGQSSDNAAEAPAAASRVPPTPR